MYSYQEKMREKEELVLDENTILPIVLNFLKSKREPFVENALSELSYGSLAGLAYRLYCLENKNIKDYAFEKLVYRLNKYIEDLEEGSNGKEETKFW